MNTHHSYPYYRDPDYVHPCSCIEGCRQKNIAVCTMTKISRNSCKFCRYMKCRSAGMVKEWVLSAYLVKSKEGEKKPTKSKIGSNRNLDIQGSNGNANQSISKNVLSKYDNMITEDHIKDLIEKDSLSSSIDKKVTVCYIFGLFLHE